MAWLRRWLAVVRWFPWFRSTDAKGDGIAKWSGKSFWEGEELIKFGRAFLKRVIDMTEEHVLWSMDCVLANSAR